MAQQAPNGGAEGLSQAAQQMHNILLRLQSPNNETRRAAEAEFHSATEHKGLCLDALATLAVAPVGEVVRSTALVLLRRWATELWDGADDNLKAVVKAKLVAGVRVDGRKDLRKKLCDTIAAIGSPLIRETPSQWPELMPMMLELAKSAVSYERESALYIFSLLTDYVDATVFNQYLPALKSAFHAGLSDADISVQIAGLRACCSLLNMLDTNECQRFVDLIPLMLRPVQQSIEKGDEDDARSSIELLIDVVETEPKFWKNHLPPVCQLMLTIASNATLTPDNSPRQMALEFLVSISEKLPSQCRKMGNFVQNVFPVALNMMLEIEDEPDWYQEAEEDDQKEYTLFACGQESLDRIAIALGGKAVLPVAEAIIPQFLQNEASWVHRHAALLALSQIGEGCQKQIEVKLGRVISLALDRFRDPHPRVRWAAINCIGQMCTDFGPSIQLEYHTQIVPNLIAVMDDAGNPRVQSHAAAAVINFCDEASPAVISPYLDALLGKLQSLLQSHHRFTQEQAVTAIAAVADSAEGAFLKYYDWFMPRLKQVLTGAAGEKDLRRLRGKVMECISLIGLSVGSEKFGRDAAEVMNVLVATASNYQGDDDPQAFYLMQAYARICRCLKADFIKYLPHVMPGLIKAAEQKPEIQVLDADDDDEDDEGDGFETLKIGDKRVGIRTSALEDKATACTMIACFIAELRGGFYSYVQQVTHLMVPLLKFFYHDECRTAAAGCLPDLFRCVKESTMDRTGQQIAELANFIVPSLLEAIKGEPDVEVLVNMVESLGTIATLVGPPILNTDIQTTICQAISMTVIESEARYMQRIHMADADDWDEEEQEDADVQQAKEEDLLIRVGDCLGALIKNHSSAGFIAAFSRPVPLTSHTDTESANVSTLQLFWLRLQEGRPANERQVALCVFDDVVLYGGQQGAELVPNLLQPMRAYVLDSDPDVRQAAIFGVGVCAQVGGEGFVTGNGSAAVQDLEKVVTHQGARTPGNEVATDNAVSALMKVLEFQPTVLGQDGARIGDIIVNYLPANQDVQEAIVMHKALIRFVQRSDVRIMGQNSVNLGKVLQIFASVLGSTFIDEEGQVALITLIKQISTTLPADVLQNATSNLSNELKQKLQQAIES